MATLLTMTKAKAQSILDQVIVSASLNGSGHLILTRSNGATIDAGDFTSIVTSVFTTTVGAAVAAAVPTAVFNAVAGTLFDRGNVVAGPIPVTGLTSSNIINALMLVTATGNLTFDSASLPSGCKPGTQFAIRITQDATGGRTLILSNFKKSQGVLTLTTTANAVDVLMFMYDGTTWYAGLMGVDFK